jgi:hypothetical protein
LLHKERPGDSKRELTYVWIGLAVGSRIGLRSVRITHQDKQIPSVQLQEGHIFLVSFFLTVQTPAIVMFGYIDVIKHNERLAEVERLVVRPV